MALSKNEKEKILEEAKRRFKEVEDFESEARILMENDLEFAYRGQWDESDKRRRDGSRRAAITIRRSSQFTNRVKNEQRQSKPQVTVLPKSDGANEFYAKRRKGLIKHIQYDSKASQAVQMAYDYAVDCGRGWIKIDTEQESGKTFAQKFVILPVRDIFSIYMDPRHTRPDYSDSMWGFEVSRVDRKEFTEAKPEAYSSPWSVDIANQNPWVHKDDITLAEYYRIEFKDRNLMKIESRDGIQSIVYEDELEGTPHKVLRERVIQERSVHWYYLSPHEVLDSIETVFKNIPLVPIIGKETIIKGTFDVKGLIRDLIDPCRMYNFWVSDEADYLANSPKPTWVAAEGQLEGHEDEWMAANETGIPYLQYNPVSLGGQMAPPPQRSDVIQIPSGIVNAKASAIDDMKAVTGIQDASLGARSNEVSGVAIRARESQGDMAIFHYPDSQAMALNQIAKIINDGIPKIYTDEGRVVQILGEEDEPEAVTIGKMNKENTDGFGDAEFDVVVTVGPSFNSKREEAAFSMIDMSKNVAIMGEGAADLIVKSQDWPGKDQVAKRIERILESKYPGLTAPMEDSDDEKLVAMSQQLNQMSQKMQELSQEREQLVMQLQKMDQEKQAMEASKVQNEIAKLDIERAKLELEAKKLDLEAAKIEADLKKADLNSETQITIKQMELSKNPVKISNVENGNGRRE